MDNDTRQVYQIPVPYVKVLAVTTPIENKEAFRTLGDFIAYIARISNPNNQWNMETSENLLKYLIKHSHWSPFEMVNVVTDIVTTRDIVRQILRHRSFSFQEFSQRYATPVYGYVTREARLQDVKNRQNSIENFDKSLDELFIEKQQALVTHATNIYEWATSHGIAKEQARVVLPEGLTVSRLYMNGTMRSWIHYCQLRMLQGTQKEHREIAQMCWDTILNFGIPLRLNEG